MSNTPTSHRRQRDNGAAHSTGSDLRDAVSTLRDALHGGKLGAGLSFHTGNRRGIPNVTERLLLSAALHCAGLVAHASGKQV
jgi:hypothetical protein